MKSFLCFSHLRISLLCMLIATMGSVNAQFLRSSYFMETAQYRMQLNPALAPQRGYVHLPAIGHINASVYSNALGVRDVKDLIKNGDDEDYYTTDDFVGKLLDENRASVNVGTDLFSAGWWHGDGFMSLNISVRADGNLSVPRELFTFMRDMKGLNNNDYSNYMRQVGQEELNVNAFTEVGVGYTRIIKDRFSIGGRVKGLLGLGNVNLKVNDAIVKTNLEGLSPDFDWTEGDPMELARATGTASVDVDAVLESSFKGLQLLTNEQGYIDDVEFKAGKMGISGYGAAFDLGVACRITNSFTVSAAMTDIGFIKWSKGATTVAHSNTSDQNYDSSQPGDIMRFVDVVGAGEALNLDMLRLTIDEQESKSRTTNLASTLAIGAEYRFAADKLGVGALFSNRFAKPKNESELTLSVNYHASSLLDFAVSYSPLMCDGKSFGVAMKLGPLFIGTDYMFMNSNKTKCCNALVGLSIPLGKKS